MASHSEIFQQVLTCYGRLGVMALPKKALEIDREILADVIMQLDELVGELETISNLTQAGDARLEHVASGLTALNKIVTFLETASGLED